MLFATRLNGSILKNSISCVVDELHMPTINKEYEQSHECGMKNTGEFAFYNHLFDLGLINPCIEVEIALAEWFLTYALC